MFSVMLKVWFEKAMVANHRGICFPRGMDAASRCTGFSARFTPYLDALRSQINEAEMRIDRLGELRFFSIEPVTIKKPRGI